MTEEGKEQSLAEWLAEEQARLDEGFTFEPKPSSEASTPGAGEEILAGLGLGAGVVGGAVASHPDTVTFEGCKTDVIVTALREEIADDDTRVQVDRAGDSTVVTILQSQERHPHQFSPALTATLIETKDTLTVTVSDLNQGAVRGTLSSVGSTVLDQGKRLLFRRRSVPGMLDTAGRVMEGIEDLVEDIQDLGLPKRVWKVIDRVGKAAEEAYLDQQRKERELQRRREQVERAWTHCQSCGRAYRDNEGSRVDCPSCGAPRGEKPAWLE
ncbi:MAG: hypothetical protein SWK90_05495 [Chloroflexota bacterium]|nr:hypothetical protein [Chloroflexota bacterium]